MNTRLITTFAILAAGAGCEKQSDNSATTATPANLAAYDAGTSIAKSDLQFMSKAAQGGMLEVELGTKASQVAASDDVRTFGNHMRTDHGQANAQLQELAIQKGVRLPTSLDAEHAEKLDELDKLKGTEFDKKYAADMVDDHEKDVSEFEQAASDLKDPELRDWANRTLPVLKMHLQMAKDMKTRTMQLASR
jgi:putative membrane protein